MNRYITILVMLTLYFCQELKAQEEYVLSSGDGIHVFIYKYHTGRAKLDIKRMEIRATLKTKGIREKGFIIQKKLKKGKIEEDGELGLLIRPDGKVTIPIIGEVEAAGKTISELDSIITERLRGRIPNPEVTVMLTGIAGAKNKVYVLGEVGSPGLYPVYGEMSLLKALAMAGSITKNASVSRIYLYRKIDTGQKIMRLRAKGLIDKLDLRENVRIYPGDIIYIPRSKIVTLNDYIGRYITPLEFMVLFFNLSDRGMLDDYVLALGLLHGFKWVFFDESPILSTSSINIPLDSWIYRDMDELACKGILKEGLISTKPLTRNELEFLVKNVKETVEVEESYRNILERLDKEFEPENKNLHGYVRTGLFYLDRKYFDYQKDQNWFGNGVNPRTEFSIGGDILPKLSLNFSGSMWYNGDRLKEDLKEGYLKINFKNLEIEVGRDHLWWGPGYHGSLLLSDNPPPFNLIKLATRTDNFKFTTFLTRLERDRFIPEPYLNGMRFEWLPFSNFTLGGSRAIMFMGKGRPSLKIRDIPTIFGGENVGGRLETNQLAGLDFTWRFKNMELYGTWAGEDQAKGLPSAEGYQLGGFFKDFFARDLDLRIEYAINRKKPHQKATWYEHHLYQSGYRYKGQIIGHHMGGDSQDVFMRLGYRLNPRLACAFEFDHERHGIIKPVEEREVKYAVELQYDVAQNFSLFIRNENWWTKNNNFTAGEDVRDSYIRLEWEYRF